MSASKLGGWLGLLLLAGCAASPPTRFYLLENPGAAGTERAAEPGASRCRIRIGAITIPGAVDRPQLVLHSGANRVEVLEQERWAEPLREAVPRVLAESLRRRLPPDTHLRMRGAPGDGSPELTVSLEFDRFELSSAGAALSLHATLQAPHGEPPRELTISAEEAAQPAGTPGVVAAASRALEQAAAGLVPALTAACGGPGAAPE